MPRIRSLKPELWQDEAIARCSPIARLLFVGLISNADDEGRQRGAAQLIKSVVMPYDENISCAEVEGWLAELERERLIVTYEGAGQRYLAIRNWSKHQRVDHAKESNLPPPPPFDGIFPEDFGDPREEGRHQGKTSATKGDLPCNGKFPETVAPDKEEEGEEEGEEEKETSAIADVSPEVYELCELLADEIERQGIKRPKAHAKRWHDAARLMMDTDGHTFEEIKSAISWAQHHSFWHRNILSMPTLREKWDRLWLEAKAERQKGASNRMAQIQQRREAREREGK